MFSCWFASKLFLLKQTSFFFFKFYFRVFPSLPFSPGGSQCTAHFPVSSWTSSSKYLSQCLLYLSENGPWVAAHEKIFFRDGGDLCLGLALSVCSLTYWFSRVYWVWRNVLLSAQRPHPHLWREHLLLLLFVFSRRIKLLHLTGIRQTVLLVSASESSALLVQQWKGSSCFRFALGVI